MKSTATSTPNITPKERIVMIEIITSISGIFTSPISVVLARATLELIKDATQ